MRSTKYFWILVAVAVITAVRCLVAASDERWGAAALSGSASVLIAVGLIVNLDLWRGGDVATASAARSTARFAFSLVLASVLVAFFIGLIIVAVRTDERPLVGLAVVIAPIVAVACAGAWLSGKRLSSPLDDPPDPTSD